MWNTSWAKHNHVLYNLNRTRKKSGEKYKKAIDWYIDILKKEDKNPDSLWVAKTKVMAQARLNKYQLKKHNIMKVLERREIQNLEKYITL